MAQQVERRLGKAEATGSNPVSSLTDEYSVYEIETSRNKTSGSFFIPISFLNCLNNCKVNIIFNKK